MTRTSILTRLTRTLAAVTLPAALILAMTLAGTAARAQFSFSAPTGTVGSGGRTTFTVQPGDTLTFYGTLANNYGDELDDVSILPEFAGTNASNFTFVYPKHLILGYPYTFNIHDTNSNNTLSITAKLTATPGTYVFDFDANAQGDDNGFYTGDIYSDYYNIVVAASGGVPGAPTSLTAAAGQQQITLSWIAPAGVSGATYNVYRGTAAGGESATAIATGVTGTTYTNTGVPPFTPYYYTVKTVSGSQTSVASNEASSAANPAPPTHLAAVGGYQKVSLTWDATSSPYTVVYDVYRGTTAGGEGTTPLATNLTTASYTDTAVTDGTAYYYTVRESGNYPTGNSNEATATPALPAPTGVTATSGPGKVTVTWTAPAGISSPHYNLYRGTASGAETLYSGNLTVTTYANAKVTVGTTYYYIVRTVAGSETSAPTAEVSGTPTGTAPAAPTNLQAVAADTKVTLTWTAPAGTVTSYTLYRGASASSLAVYKSGITSTTFANGFVTNGTTYFYSVAAVNASGTSPQSNVVSATPQAAGGVPAAPTNLTATASGGKVSLAWTAPAGTVTSYSLYRGTASGAETLYKSGITNTTFVNGTVTVGTHYYYTVKAVNSVGTSVASNEANATP